MARGAAPPVRVLVREVDDTRQAVGEYEALLRDEDEGEHTLLPADGTPLPDLPTGTVLVLARPRANDAMYVRPVRVTGTRTAEGGYLVGDVGAERREQQRAHVRVAAPPVEVVLTPLDADGSPAYYDAADQPISTRAQLLDVSAGGCRVVLDEPPFLRGGVARIQFTLPHESRPVPIDVAAECRWIRTGSTASSAGLMYLDLRPLMEQRITGWVFQQEARQRAVRRD